MSGEANTNAENSSNTETTTVEGGTTTETTEAGSETTTTTVTEVDKDSAAFKSAVEARVDEIVGARVARQKDKTTAAETKVADLEKQLSDLQTSFDSIKGEKETAEADRDKASRDVTRFKLAIEEGVSTELIATLQGDTEDELRAAIKVVTSSMGGGNGVNRLFNGKQTEAAELSEMQQLHEDAQSVFRNNF